LASATIAVPMLPVAPGLFSTTTCWPRISETRGASRRPTTSVGPPAAKAMIMRIGLSG